MTISEKLGIVFSVFAIAALLVLIIFGRHGLMDLKKIHDKEASIQASTADVRKKNRRLADQVQALKEDPVYIEHVAKHEHEMIGEDEFVFKITGKNRSGKESEE